MDTKTNPENEIRSLEIERQLLLNDLANATHLGDYLGQALLRRSLTACESKLESHMAISRGEAE